MITVEHSGWSLGSNAIRGAVSTEYAELTISSTDLLGLIDWTFEQMRMTRYALTNLAATSFVNGFVSTRFDSDCDENKRYWAQIDVTIEHGWRGGEPYDLRPALDYVVDGWFDFAPIDYDIVSKTNF